MRHELCERSFEAGCVFTNLLGPPIPYGLRSSPISWSHAPNIAIAWDTSSTPRHDVRNDVGLHATGARLFHPRTGDCRVEDSWGFAVCRGPKDRVDVPILHSGCKVRRGFQKP